MKLLHTSDWHLGKKPSGSDRYSETRYEDYFKAAEYVVDRAIELGVDVFIIAGDLFDSNKIDAETLYRAEVLLTKLKDNSIRTLAIAGNHDRAYESESWIRYLEKRELIECPEVCKDGETYQFKTFDIHGFKIYGIQYFGELTSEVLAELAKRLDGNNNVVICHTAISNWKTEDVLLPGCVTKDVVDLFSGKVRYFAAGHFHSFSAYPENSPFFFIPGSLEYWDLYEDDEKGFIVYDLENGTYDFYPSYKRKRSIHKVLSTELYEYAEKLNVDEGELVILKVQISHDGCYKTDEVKKLLMQKGALHVQIDLEYDNVSKIDFKRSTFSKEMLERMIISSWRNPFSTSDQNINQTHEFIKWAKSIIAEASVDTSILFERFDALLDFILGDGKDDN
ncbi:metallophosphoesterase family protein [Fervidobacterium thailandense]|uniref:Calcineurin-like phosphoesterase domain-containing protein n=1 Tax=Fervidobacterium thailandense TaxID=1008305 RepID=A0A1E3G3V6_9BACT|nr:exonuclease SbcCD subunit D [Fervidobacterium thailandense]ODN30493.1 hypothetical protein A4H02_05555 [Fervidobacterium thailandense]